MHASTLSTPYGSRGRGSLCPILGNPKSLSCLSHIVFAVRPGQRGGVARARQSLSQFGIGLSGPWSSEREPHQGVRVPADRPYAVPIVWSLDGIQREQRRERKWEE